MTVETTLQKMFDEYPDLFSTRQECYNHLFCTNGNGYEWKRGQIVPCEYEEDGNIQMREEAEAADYAALTAAWESAGIKPKAVQSETNVVKRRKEDEELHNLKRENDLEDGLPDIGPYDPDRRHWYPISKYSLINNVPDDIKPDWKAAVEECKLMLADDGIRWQGCLEDIRNAPAF